MCNLIYLLLFAILTNSWLRSTVRCPNTAPIAERVNREIEELDIPSEALKTDK